jgi:hypothetical protein
MVAQGLADPRKSDSADHRLTRSITTYIASCKTDDPPALPQQAIPSSVIRWIANNMGRSQQQHTIVTAHLIVLAFFFLLRVGEYTHSREKRRTIPLRKKDIRLWRAGTILPNDSPLDVLVSADVVTICLENQKNGHKNAVLHHTSSKDTSVDPVKSAAISSTRYATSQRQPQSDRLSMISRGYSASRQTKSAVRSKSELYNQISRPMATACLASAPIVSGLAAPCTSN